MLSRQLADAAHYPAIDLAGSISRVMNNLVSPALLKAANRFRRLWTLYQQNQDLIQVGAYEAGTNADLDEAIRLRPGMEALLQQGSEASVSIDDSQKMLQQLTGQAGD
jgi:flagellum-specific ATP synthase|tara:strand:- start:190 stop:513 length:324 start_codon:yes stop_codon:yes gene_type:complete